MHFCLLTFFYVFLFSQIHHADMLEVNNSTANRKDWNAYVVKTRTCPWTAQAQNPLY